VARVLLDRFGVHPGQHPANTAPVRTPVLGDGGESDPPALKRSTLPAHQLRPWHREPGAVAAGLKYASKAAVSKWPRQADPLPPSQIERQHQRRPTAAQTVSALPLLHRQWRHSGTAVRARLQPQLHTSGFLWPTNPAMPTGAFVVGFFSFCFLFPFLRLAGPSKPQLRAEQAFDSHLSEEGVRT